MMRLAVAVLLLGTALAEAGQSVSALAPFETYADGFRDLRGIAVDAAGAVYVADRDAGTVIRIDTDLARVVVASNLERPIGLAVEPEGHVLVADERAGRLVRIEPSGPPVPLLTDVKQPRWLAVGADGTLYVSARGLARNGEAEPDDESAEPEMILALAPGGPRFVFADGFRGLQGLVASPESVWAASRGRQSDSQTAGVVSRIAIEDAGRGGSPTSPLTGDIVEKPFGLARDRLGALWLTAKELSLDQDKSKRIVAKLAPSGALTLFALNLDDPKGLAFDPSGHLYVADGAAGRVVRFRAPLAPVLSVPSPTRQTPLVLTGRTEPGARVDIFVDGVSTAPAMADSAGAFAASVALRQDAAVTITVFATTHAGHGLTSPAAEAIVLHDATGPTLEFLTPPAGAHVRAEAGVGARAGDAGSGVASLVLTAAGRSLAAVVTPAPPATVLTSTATWATATVPDGAHTLAATAADQAGNMATTTRVVVVDNTPPETLITAGPAQGAEISADGVTFAFAGSDNLTPTTGLVFSWRLDGGPWSPADATTTTAFFGVAEGPHVFEVVARDLAGNLDPTPAQRTFHARRGPVIASVTPEAGPVGTPVTITGMGFIPGETSVVFNGLAAAIRAGTATQLVATVPIGATSGPLSVTTTAGSASRPFVVTPTGDFALGIRPTTARVIAGDRTWLTVDVDGLGAFAGLVALSVPTLPTGISASLTPRYVAPGARATLDLEVAETLPPGAHDATVRAEAQVDGRTITHTVRVGLEVLPPETTAITGRVLTAETVPQPILGVTVTLGSAFALTDAGGNFALLAPPVGRNMLYVDGRTASTPTAQYPPVEVRIDVAPSGPTRLPFALYLPVLDTAHPITLPIDGNGFTTAEIGATTPLIPDLVVTIPRNTRITGSDGTPVAQITMTPVPADRSPMPLPTGVTAPMLFTIQPGGAVPSEPLPIAFPNVQNAPPGSVADLYFFDLASGAWAVWGTGTVSADGRQIVSEPGVGLPRLAWHFASSRVSLADDVRTREPGRATAGEPVDLPTGRFVVQKTDLVLPGRIPVAVQRTYRSESSAAGLLGVGWTLEPYDTRLTTAGTSMSLILPDQSRNQFTPSGPGQWINTQQTFLRGAVLTRKEGDFVFELRYKDGVVHRFERVAGFADLAALTRITDRNGNTVALIRAHAFQQNRISQIIEPAGRRLTLDYDAAGRITAVTDPTGRRVLYAYDALGRLETVTDPAGGTTRYSYGAGHRIEAITDPRAIVFVRNQYDASGRVIRQVQADGGTWEFAYRLNGALVTEATVTDPRGNPTTYRFTSEGRTRSVTDALGQTTLFEYDPVSNLLVETTDPLGRVTRYEHDPAGNLTALVDPARQSWTLTYEPTFGRVTSITDPLARVTRFEYDTRGNLLSVADPLGDRTTLDWDASGQVTRVVDPLQQATVFTHDAHGNLAAFVDPLGHATTRRWDPVSRLLAQTDPLGRTTRFAYDPLNRVTRIEDSLGGLTELAYDGNGNVLAITDARRHTTRYTYDVMDRLQTRTDPVDATDIFAYDAAGNLTQRTDRKRQTTMFSHDALNRRVGAVYADATVHTTYDAVGRVTLLSDSGSVTLQNRYDVLDRLLAQTSPLGTTGYEYDALGRRTRMTVPDQPDITYGYDAASRLTTITRDGQVVGLEYDEAGRRARLTLPNDVSTEYRYDAGSRLTALIYRHAATPLGELTYQYDPTGNRVRVGGSFAQTLLPDSVPSTVYDAANRQRDLGGVLFAYDANGNLVSAGTTTYTWDARDRLVSVEAPGTTATFTYDALGRRSTRVTDGRATRYLFDELDVAAELLDLGTVSHLRSLALDELFVRGDRFYLADGSGNTIAITDAAGTIVDRFSYEPFGAQGRTGTRGGLFAGRAHDTPDGLYDFRLRYYAAAHGRFLSEDPLGWLAGPNAYQYARSNPLGFTDPLGLDVTVVLYRGRPTNPFNHIGAGINTQYTYGLTPRNASANLFRGLDVPGQVVPDRNIPLQRITIETSPAQDRRMSEVILRALSTPQTYNLSSRNCVAFVAEVLRAGGIQVPTTTFPVRLMDYLQERYGTPEVVLIGP